MHTDSQTHGTDCQRNPEEPDGKLKTVFPRALNYTSLLLWKWVCCFSHGFI